MCRITFFGVHGVSNKNFAFSFQPYVDNYDCSKFGKQPKVDFTFGCVENFWVENAVGNRRLQQGQWFFEQRSRRRKAEKTGAENNNHNDPI